MINKDTAKVVWYPGTTKEATDQGYEVVDQSGDSFFAESKQSPENRGFRRKPQPMVGSWDGEYMHPYHAEGMMDTDD